MKGSRSRSQSKKTSADKPAGMFSPASFAGVVSNYDPTQKSTAEELPSSTPPVVAFYGFRGGAGRTTTLAHVCALLAARQVQVVAIDLDLEAPGLHHVLGCPAPEEDRGVLALLRAAAVEGASDAIRLAPHVVRSGLDSGTPVRVIPAGRLSERYLDRLEDLGVPLWHVADGPSPLEMVVQQVKDELRPQIIFLDCRTGLSDLSASAMFHVADVVVCFVPVSEQALDGLEVFLKAAKAGMLKRHGRPELLIVPSMVPEGPEGRRRLDEWLVREIETRYASIVLGTKLTDENAEAVGELVPVVRDGIEYRRGIALADHIRNDFVQRSAGLYQPLLSHLETLVGVTHHSPQQPVASPKILTELIQKADLKNLAFAESTPPEAIVKKFIQPSDFKALVDRGTWYVVGAKGAGKTWLWTYLLSEVGGSTSPEMTYLAAHGPGSALLSANALRELERDKSIRMIPRHVHGALWLLYAAKRLLTKFGGLLPTVVGGLRGDEKALIQSLMEADERGFQDALGRTLTCDRVGSLAEHVIRTLDQALLTSAATPVTLLYDGLDVGFGSDEKAIEMRARYVNALVETIEPLRGAFKRVFFKLFLREDIFSDLVIQNQSHLAAATVELRWEPRDLWVLALNLLSESPGYLEVIRGIDATASPASWPQEDERRQRLLEPLWGAQMEAGNKISTALFVQRRTADGKGRLFPRTLVQLLAAAVEHQQTIEARQDRVLRSAAIQSGYKKASEKRVDDLRKEYAGVSEYLDGLKGMTPTGTEAQIRDHIRKRSRRSSAKGGVTAGALQAGPGGWHKVIERFLEMGVLREYRRGRGDDGSTKYEIALLYRPGLGIKAFGL